MRVSVGAAAAGLLRSGAFGTDFGSTRSYEQRPRAPCLCHWGARSSHRLLCSGLAVRVGPNPIWPGSLGRQATWERCFESSRHFSIPGDGAAAAGAKGGGERRRRLTDFDPIRYRFFRRTSMDFALDLPLRMSMGVSRNGARPTPTIGRTHAAHRCKAYADLTSTKPCRPRFLYSASCCRLYLRRL
jgi:hypothetical protein